MKLTLNLAALLLVAANLPAQQTLVEHKWTEVPAQAVSVSMDGRDAIKIENTNDSPLQVTLLTITNPLITAMSYELVGDIRYDSVHGDGFLEMWNYFPPEKPGLPEGQYFSRTLGESGDMGKISGTSDWRRFGLPFDRTGAPKPPVRLQINLVLRGRGTVYLSPVKLVQFPGAKSSAWVVPNSAWWSNRAANMVGGFGGAFIGCLCGFCGWLASQGRARAFVTVVYKALAGMGIMLLGPGIVAIALHQPYMVWYPLIFGAIILLSVCPIGLRQYRRRYEEMELRRMESIDAAAV